MSAIYPSPPRGGGQCCVSKLRTVSALFFSLSTAAFWAVFLDAGRFRVLRFFGFLGFSLGVAWALGGRWLRRSLSWVMDRASMAAVLDRSMGPILLRILSSLFWPVRPASLGGGALGYVLASSGRL